MSDDILQEEGEMGIKTYDMSNIPAYRKPIVEELIVATEMFLDDYDTPENLDAVAVRILDKIVERHILDAHLRANIQPENHD